MSGANATAADRHNSISTTMAALLLLLLCPLLSAASQPAEEPNPFVEAAKTLLQDQLQNQGGGAGGLGAVGALLQGFMQSGGGKQLGDMFKDGDLLSTIGSALSGGQQQGSGGGIDPQLIGAMINMFASGHSDENNNDVKQGRAQQVDWGGMADIASNLLGSQQGQDGGSPLDGLLGLLPVLLQSGGSESSSGEVGRPSMFAPILAGLRDYWNHFTNSEFGQTLWKTSGLEATLRLFTDEKGDIDMDRVYRSLENASFRKRWVRSLSTYVAEWIAHVSDPATQKRYLTTAQFMANGFLKAQGYPKSVMFDSAKPAESLSRLVNAVFKKQFGLKIESATYIKPAVTYLQEAFELGKAKGLSLSHLSPKEIEDRLTDTISGEIIEPTMRVWRAYRYGTRHPQCDQYVICTVNQKDTSIEGGLKPGVTKISSMVAIWFLSSNTGTPFWKLYNAAVEDHNCQVQYPVNCDTFHEEDVKATTEYAHSEL